MVIEIFPIQLTVENKVNHAKPLHYHTSVVEGGILVSALRRLHENNKEFTFTVKDNLNFGLFLESVNGRAGSVKDKTYWELLSKKHGKEEPLKVGEYPPYKGGLMSNDEADVLVIRPLNATGIGCYQPTAKEEIILRFTTW